MKIDLRTIAAITAVIIAIYGIYFMIEFKDELAASPCELCEKHGFECRPSLEYGNCFKNGTTWYCQKSGLPYYEEWAMNFSLSELEEVFE